MRVLVCGGRDYADWGLLSETLDRVACAATHVIHGGARGADSLADRWAGQHGKTRIVYPANWAEQGRSAGPIRNRKMLVEGDPDLVVAFPGGRGTANMVGYAKAAGVAVLEVT